LTQEIEIWFDIGQNWALAPSSGFSGFAKCYSTSPSATAAGTPQVPGKTRRREQTSLGVIGLFAIGDDGLTARP